jgi:predicted HicB family RNase H-like nuclease
MIEYKGYTGVVEFSGEERMFYGEVVGLRDIIGFEGSTVDELEDSMHQAVDLYLEMCEEDGTNPDKPYSGKFQVRVTSEVHRALVTAAASSQVSLNTFVTERFKEMLG